MLRERGARPVAQGPGLEHLLNDVIGNPLRALMRAVPVQRRPVGKFYSVAVISDGGVLGHEIRGVGVVGAIHQGTSTFIS